MSKEEEFVDTIRQNEGIIYKITKVYCANAEDQKDLYQDIVYQLWKSFDSFNNNSKLSTWIYRVALNTALTYKKSTKRILDKPYDNIVDAERHISTHIDPDHKERIDNMYYHLRALPESDKAIILLYLEGKNHSDIAQITGYSKSNVGTRISRIKQKLKNSINQ